MAGPRKLTVKQVRYIRRCARIRRETPSLRALAVLLGVDQKAIRNAANGMTFKRVR